MFIFGKKKSPEGDDYKALTENLYKQNLKIVSLYKEVDKLNHELQLSNEGQADLLRIINHQIKGYMTKGRYVLDAMLHDKEYGPVSDSAKAIMQEGYDSMTEGVNFVQNFLNAANIEKGTYTYQMEPVDFKEVVEEVSRAMEASAKERNLTYELNVGDGDYNLTGDKSQLAQAVRNLIDNSIKYTPAGRVKARLERKGDKILLTVTDTGVGLSDEVKTKLFTKGGRDKDSQKINISSTGFGLAYVRGVIEAHQGRVWADSPGHGHGSTFYLELPV